MGAVDGFPQVNTSDDGLVVTVFPPKEGGKKLPFDALKAEIEGRGVKGVKWEDVKKAVDASSGRPVVLIPPKARAGDAQIFVEIDAEEMEAKVTV